MTRRVLVVSMSMGSGHTRAAQAVLRKIGQLQPDARVHLVDLAEHLAAPLRAFYVGGYLTMIRRLPWLWGLLYRHPPSRRGGTLPRGWLWRSMLSLRRLVEDFRPHLLLASQITASEAASVLVERGAAPAAASIITDYDGHVSWKDDHIARFFVADEAVREQLIRVGVAPERVVASGIPVHDEFEHPLARDEARRRLGLRPDAPVVLLMGGALGLGRIRDCLDDLLAGRQSLQLIAVTGYDGALRRALEQLRPPPHVELRVLGYVDNVHELMAAADVFVSKPGGLSMTEALHVGLPTVVVAALPGQEVANARHLANAGCVRVVSKGESVASAVEDVLAGGAAALRAAAARFRKRDSALAIAREVLDLAAAGEPLP